jgi:hypothetical protein
VARHRFLMLAGLILVVGAGLRFAALERQSLWDDEMSTVHDMRLGWRNWPQRFATYETHPPLYFLQLRPWRAVFGGSLASLRANSAFWGTVSLALLLLLMRVYCGREVGLWAMALMAVSPYHLAYSQELRPYALAIALAIGGWIVLEAALRKPRRWVFWTLGAIWTAELYTHYWNSFVVLAQWVYGMNVEGGRSTRRRFIGIGLLSAALFVPWLPFLRTQLRLITELSFWVAPASPANLAKALVAFTGLFFHYASLTFRAPGPLALHVIIGLLFLAALACGVKTGPRAAVVWLFIGLGVPYVLSYWVHGLFVWYRYPVVAYPAFIILVSSIAQESNEQWSMSNEKGLQYSLFIARCSLLSLFVLSGLSGCWTYFTTFQKANPKAVVAYVDALESPRAVVVRPSYFGELFSYYDRGTAPVIDQHTLSTPEERAALKGKQVILVAFDVPSDPVGEALRSEFTVVSRRHFPSYAHLGITVYELR